MNKTPVFLYVIVAVAGASVLALEILGTRILGPTFGVSLFLWSALITVTLAALSAGYLAGGHWADGGATHRRLSLLPGLAGAWIIAIPWVQSPVIGMVSGWGLRASVLGAALLLFFIPLMLLGAVTPYALRLTLSSVERAGRTSGRLFALSTMASVASAILTGFYLIPHLGVLLLSTLLGSLLLLTAAIGFAGAGGGRPAIPGSLLLAFAGLAAPFFSPVERADPASGLIAVSQSPYAEIRIFDRGEERHFLIDHGIHSRIDRTTGRSTLLYTALMEFPMRYFPRPGSMLLIGLGGGSLVKSYAEGGWDVDAVEIDPEVIVMAREYFGLGAAGGNVHEMDGRGFLAATKKSYDVVLIDAYGSSSIPFHLVTAEAFRLAKSVLNQGGVVALNVISQGWTDPLVLDLAATLRVPFRDVLALPMAEPPDRLGNLILLASDRDLAGVPEPERNVDLDPVWRYGSGYAVNHAWDNRFRPDAGRGVVMTDDRNLVDIRSNATMAAARTQIIEYLGQMGVRW